MEKRKSIEDLISSIYYLVNEAKEEFEKIKKEDLGHSIFAEKRNIQDNLNKEIKKPSNQSLDSDNSKLKNIDKNPADWESIEFNKSSNKIIETDNAQHKFINLEDDVMKNKFNLSLNNWIEKNLKRLIELEFSNYIRIRNDQ